MSVDWKDEPDWAKGNNTARFFVWFSRFEFALKMSNRCKSRNGDAMPDWEKFEKDMGSIFFETHKERCDLKILIDAPPKKQTVEGKKPIWEDKGAPVTDTKSLFKAVRRVRNNLFHGGKYPNGPVREPSRDDKLIAACLLVLELALEHDKEVGRAFLGSLE